MRNSKRTVAAWGTGTILAATLGAAPAMGASADPQIERGRYVALIGGCNDCHTAGFAPSGGKVPESEWFKGDSLGWRGPWGTTFAPNLRIYVRTMTEDAWVKAAKTLKTRPPMPWWALQAMSEPDLRALYRFIRSVGEPGAPAPPYLPPDKAPAPPYVELVLPPAKPGK
jgi:mono/diheme cytochrome c family protein